MNINDFKAFASSLSANVETQAQFELDPVLYQGFETGTASSAKLNKVWRQSAFISAAVAQFVANAGHDVLDDGNLNNFLNLFLNARGSFLTKSVAGGSDVTLNPVYEANYVTLYLTGILTANINVIVPAGRQASWNIINATSGAFTLKLAVAGGTSVLIPASASSVVVSDGTSPYLIGSISSGGGGGSFGVIPQNLENADYTFVLADTGKHIYSKNTGAQSLTLPTNAAVPFSIGAAITIVNNGTTSISIITTGTTVYKAGNNTAWPSGGTLGLKGFVTLLKVEIDTWFISGNGLS